MKKTPRALYGAQRIDFKDSIDSVFEKVTQIIFVCKACGAEIVVTKKSSIFNVLDKAKPFHVLYSHILKRQVCCPGVGFVVAYKYKLLNEK